MDTIEVTRRMTYDYLVFVPALAAIFNLYLIAGKKWKELAVFNVGGLINIVMEIALIRAGHRHFDTDSPALMTAAVLCLGWVTNGFLCSVAYIDVKHWLKRTYSTGFIVAVNLFLFAGLPLAMIRYGAFDGGISVWRDVPTGAALVEPVIFAVLAAVIWFSGYRKLLVRMFLIGFLIDLHFEGSLLLFGVRAMEQFNLIHFITRVLFEMNVFLCLGFLLLKLVFKLNDYKDSALATL